MDNEVQFKRLILNVSDAASSGDIFETKKRMHDLLDAYPDRFEAKIICAQHYLELQDCDKAYELMKECVSIAPNDINILLFAYQVFSTVEDYEMMADVSQKCIDVEPGNSKHYSRLAFSYFNNKQYMHAFKVWEFIDCKFKLSVEELCEMATCSLNLGQGLDISISYCLRALEMEPGSVVAGLRLALLLSYHGEAEYTSICFKKLAANSFLNNKIGYPHLYSNYLLSVNYDPNGEFSNRFIFKMHKEYNDTVGQICTEKPSYITQKKKCNEPINIGFVSGDFKIHPVSFFLIPLLENINRKKFNIRLYSTTQKKEYDKMTDRLKCSVDEWVNLDAFTPSQSYGKITSYTNDILIDLSGHTSLNLLVNFSRRMSDCQINWLGYPNTTGLENMDFRIVDAITDPIGYADQFASEELIRLNPCFLCYSNPSHEVMFDPKPIEGSVVFSTFNNLMKFSKATLRTWSAILNQVPNSKLLFKYHFVTNPDVSDNFMAKLETVGISRESVQFLPAIPSFEEHLYLFNSVHISLDPFPYNGTTSTCDALFMGVPVVALRGNRHASRVSASILTACGLDELIADTEDEYIDIALKLAKMEVSIMEYKHHVRNAMLNSPVMDQVGFTNRFEECLTELYSKKYIES